MNNEWLGDVLAAHETGAGVGGSFTDAHHELEQGRKQGHWMWFIFPQWIGLGKTDISGRFGVKNLDDAMASLQHDALRANYRAVVAATRTHLEQGTHLNCIFGSPDDRKCVSSLTLMKHANARLGIDDDLGNEIDSLLELVDGQGFCPCARTLQWLSEQP